MKKPISIDLDALLEPDAAALWMKISKKALLEGARKGRIPVCELNARVLRFHPRTILAKLGGVR